MKKLELDQLEKRLHRLEHFVATLDVILFSLTVLVGYAMIIWLVF
jgi:hypothetical protein